MVALLAIVSFLALLVAAPGYVLKMAVVAVLLAVALIGAAAIVGAMIGGVHDWIGWAWIAGCPISVLGLRKILFG